MEWPGNEGEGGMLVSLINKVRRKIGWYVSNKEMKWMDRLGEKVSRGLVMDIG